MARYSAETRRTPAEVLERAVAFFGPGGLGLTVEEQGDNCVCFSGGGGYVRVQVAQNERGRTGVTLETQELDYRVRRLLETL